MSLDNIFLSWILVWRVRRGNCVGKRRTAKDGRSITSLKRMKNVICWMANVSRFHFKGNNISANSFFQHSILLFVFGKLEFALLILISTSTASTINENFPRSSFCLETTVGCRSTGSVSFQPLYGHIFQFCGKPSPWIINEWTASVAMTIPTIQNGKCSAIRWPSHQLIVI